MKQTKKLFVVLLAFALVLLLGVCAAAEGGDAPDVYVSGSCGAEGSNVTWTLSTDGVLTISGRGEMKNYRHMQPDMAPWYKSTGAHTDYPSVVKAVVEEGVTSIGDFAFHGLRQLCEVSLPSTVTHFGDQCFSFCESLETLELPAGLTKIEIRAFRQAEGLTHITIPEGVTVIEQQAFEACGKLTSITLPDSLTAIGEYAFNGTALTTFHVSAGLETIDYRALPTNLITAYSADENNPNFAADEAGCLYTKDMQTLLYYPVANTRTAFTVPAGVKTIDGFAFSDAQYLETVHLPDGLETIGLRAFSGCRKMTSAYIPDSVTQIGGSAFSFTPLESIHLPASLTYIPGGIFYACPFTSFEVPEGVTAVEDYAFEWCENLKTVTLPSSLETIGRDAFYGTAVDEIYFGGSEAQWYAIEIDNMSNGNRRIHEAQKHFTNNFLPEGHDWDDGIVQQALTCEQSGIRLYTCADCGETYTETVPAIGHRYDSGTRTKAPDCEEKGENTFTCVICGNTYTEEIPAFGHRWEYNIHPSYDESVPGTVAAICLTNCLHKRFFEIPGYGWTLAFGECGTEGSDVHYVLYQNGTIYVFGNGAIKDQAFFRIGVTYNQTFTKLIIDEGVTAIGKHAFGGNCISDITLPDSLKTIDDGAFADMTIRNIHFGSGLETIGSAFSTCFSGGSQKTLVLPDSVKTVRNNAFAYCDGLEEITFGPNVETVGNQALYCAFHMKKATFLNGNTEIDIGAVSEAPADFTIYSHAGGKVEAFANAAGYNFVAIDAGHDWNDWEWKMIPMQGRPGEKIRSCRTCQTLETMEVPFTDDWDYEWVSLPTSPDGLEEGDYYLDFSDFFEAAELDNEALAIYNSGEFAFVPDQLLFWEKITIPAALSDSGEDEVHELADFAENDAFEFVVYSLRQVGEQWYPVAKTTEGLQTGDWYIDLSAADAETRAKLSESEIYYNPNGDLLQYKVITPDMQGSNLGMFFPLMTNWVHLYADWYGDESYMPHPFYSWPEVCPVSQYIVPEKTEWIPLPYTTDGLSDGDWYLDLDAFMDMVGRGKSDEEKAEVRALIEQHVVFSYNPGGEQCIYKYEFTDLPAEDGTPVSGTVILPLDLTLGSDDAFPYDYNALQQCVRQYHTPTAPDTPQQPADDDDDGGNWFDQHIIRPLRSAIATILSFFRRLFGKKR